MMVEVWASHRGVKTLLSSVPFISFLFVIGWRNHWHHQHCHARFSQHHLELHLTGMDPGSLRGSHEYSFWTDSERSACESLT